MTMSDSFFQILVYSIFPSSVVSLLIVWLTRAWISERLKGAIQTEYQQKLETHKAQLKAESDVTLERLKSQLQIAAVERQVRYSRIFERTAETTAETYKRILTLNKAARDFAVHGGEAHGEHYKEKLFAELMAFFEYFRPNKLYLPKSTAGQIDCFIEQLKECLLDLSGISEYDPTLEEKRKRRQITTQMLEELPRLLGLLEDHFREVLGIVEKP